MTGRTHLLTGLAVGMALATVNSAQPPTMAAMGAVAGIAALIPDIDHPQSLISGWPVFGLLSRVLTIGIRHRGPTHSGLAIAAVAAVMLAIAAPLELTIAAMAGYASHLALDSLTVAGVPLLWPLPWRFAVLPRVRWVNRLVWLLDDFFSVWAIAAIGVMLWT